MDNNKLIVIRPVCDSRERATRLDLVLAPWLDEIEKNGIHVILLERAEDLLNTDLRDSRILFAISLTEAGVNIEYYRLLEHLRAHHDCLSGSAGGIIVDGAGEFYTKAIARRFAFSADMAGCTFPGKALVEATGSLGNFHVLSQISGKEPIEVYKAQVGELVHKVLGHHEHESGRKPRILAVHASTRSTSNTLLLWDKVRSHLDGHADITEISLRNGELFDCRGCSYETCLHFGEHGSCFYGGVITEQVFPAILDADALVMICPNYNDAVSANLTAFINRLTAIFRSNDFSEKKIYALIVSGYSGGDIIAEQIIGALSFNKAFILPPGFAMLETANDPESILKVEGIDKRAEAFAENILTGF
ncbi:MAG: NAD(P)H-dependent oxidoreductase [Mogibacterium sp.]|nr:NAD(P)H-dependent oxidoreductase [Mogibacterium sp.]